jgi:hypothetical protein
MVDGTNACVFKFVPSTEGRVTQYVNRTGQDSVCVRDCLKNCSLFGNCFLHLEFEYNPRITDRLPTYIFL